MSQELLNSVIGECIFVSVRIIPLLLLLLAYLIGVITVRHNAAITDITSLHRCEKLFVSTWQEFFFNDTL